MNDTQNEKESAKKTEDDTRPKEVDVAAERDKIADDLSICEKAPEWAEHQRWHDDDQACDDGRSGRLEEKE